MAAERGQVACGAPSPGSRCHEPGAIGRIAALQGALPVNRDAHRSHRTHQHHVSLTGTILGSLYGEHSGSGEDLGVNGCPFVPILLGTKGLSLTRWSMPRQELPEARPGSSPIFPDLLVPAAPPRAQLPPVTTATRRQTRRAAPSARQTPRPSRISQHGDQTNHSSLDDQPADRPAWADLLCSPTTGSRCRTIQAGMCRPWHGGSARRPRRPAAWWRRLAVIASSGASAARARSRRVRIP